MNNKRRFSPQVTTLVNKIIHSLSQAKRYLLRLHEAMDRRENALLTSQFFTVHYLLYSPRDFYIVFMSKGSENDSSLVLSLCWWRKFCNGDIEIQ